MINYDPPVMIHDKFYDSQVVPFLLERSYGCMDRRTIPYSQDGETGVFYEVSVAFDGAGRAMRRTQFTDILKLIRYTSLYSLYLVRYTDLAGQVSEWKCQTTEESLDRLQMEKVHHEFGDWQMYKQAEDEDNTGLFPGPDPVICRFYFCQDGSESWMLREAEYRSLGEGRSQMKEWKAETRDGYGQIYISIYHVEIKRKETVKTAAAAAKQIFSA